MAATGVVQAAEVLDGNLTGNMTITSNYVYRGISMSQNGPAVQGGIDYAHKSGLYIGNWNSSFRTVPNLSNDDIDATSNVQMNVYGGWKKDIYKGLTVDAGYNTLNFPTASKMGDKTDYNTAEFYGAISYKPLTVKYSQTTTNYFGLNNSSGTQYLQADIKQSLGLVNDKLKDLSLVAHYGNTKVANHSNLNYNDINAGLVYAFPQQWDLSVVYYTNTAMSKQFQAANSWNGSKYYSNTTVVSLTKSF